ncbi:MAG: exodeoxyribonuclease VII large subunit [Bryobacteraceae bacterium]
MEQIALNWTPEPHFFSVSELTTAMRGLFTEYFQDIWVAGEISGVKLAVSGHYYFTLKDQEAQLRCVCYKMTARFLKFKPQDGVAVLARGRVDLYEARGEVQLIVEAIEPQGHGALQLAFEQLKKKLESEGLFASDRKRKLPSLPERIGIVTSPTGAVIQDMLNVLERRCPGRHIRLYPAQVQGEGAAEQIASGVEYFSESGWAEVVIVARGGGSLEDLWAFNEERVARAIAACSVPVISAVGHETDFTIADFVADLRAPTPSAAAEIVIATRESLAERLNVVDHKLLQSMRLKIALLARALHGVAIDRARLHQAIGKQMQRVDDLDYRMRDQWRSTFAARNRALDSATAKVTSLDVRLRLSAMRRKLEACNSAVSQSMRLQLNAAKAELTPLEAHLKQLSPLAILERGYSIVEREGKIVKSPEDAPAESEIRVRLAKGQVRAKVVSQLD